MSVGDYLILGLNMVVGSILILAGFILYKIYQTGYTGKDINVLSTIDTMILVITVIILTIFVYARARITGSWIYRMVTKL